MSSGTFSQVRDAVVRCLKANITPYIAAQPAVGKSAMAQSIADEYNLALIDCRVAQMATTDFNGLPRFDKDRATFVPFDVFPLEDTPIPEGKQGWLLFLDELSSAPKHIQAPA